MPRVNLVEINVILVLCVASFGGSGIMTIQRARKIFPLS